jgi:acyl carrier protein
VNEQALRQLIVDLLAGEAGAAAGREPALTDDGALWLTSLELVRLLVMLEERLGLELDDAAIMNATFDTVDDIVAVVARSRKLAEQPVMGGRSALD